MAEGIAAPPGEQLIEVALPARRGSVEDGSLRFQVPEIADHIIEQMRSTGRVYEEAMLAAILASPPGEGLIVDIGANIGTHSLVLARGLGRKVIAVEPNPEAQSLLRANIALNGLEDEVTVQTFALGARTSRGRLRQVQPGNLASVYIDEAPEGEVEILRLDDFDLNDRVALIKIDVEGHELQVIDGGLERIGRDLPDLYVECGDMARLGDLFDRLHTLGYQVLGRFNATPTYFLRAEGSESLNGVTVSPELKRIEERLSSLERRQSSEERRRHAMQQDLRSIARDTADTTMTLRHSRSSRGAADMMVGHVEKALRKPWPDMVMLPFRMAVSAHTARRRAREEKATPLMLPRLRHSKDSPIDERVSVVMTTYNSAEHLETAIESVRAQSYGNFELIIVDDHSSDESHDIACHLAERDTRLRPVRLQRNVGTYVAKNIGISLSRSGYFATHDSDDRSHPEWLAVCLGHFVNEPERIVVMGTYVRIDPDGNLLSNRGVDERPALMAAVYRREPVLETAGYFDAVRSGADVEYQQRIRLLFGSAAVRTVPLALYNALVREGQLTQQFGVALDTADLPTGTLLVDPKRFDYAQEFKAWHKTIAEGDAAARSAARLPLHLTERPFAAHETLEVMLDCSPETLIADDWGERREDG
ncbi:MAG: FkbM family methyltransferase [Pseudomonadota bacterium]